MIGSVVIASGYSRRMGRSKLTLELGGATFLERAIRAACEATRVGRRLVVVRPEDAHLVPASAPSSDGSSLAVETLPNPSASEGQSASVRLAAGRLAADPACEAVIYVVVDQPFLSGRELDALAEAWADGRGEILVSTYDGQRGNPVLFARRFFHELQQISGDVGGREVMRRHADVLAEVPMPDPAAGRDVDTWEEYEAARRRLS